MPNVSRKEKILEEMYKMLQELMNERNVGTPAQQQTTEDEINELLEAIVEADQLRYGWKEAVPKSQGFICDVLPNYDERRFQRYLRVSPVQFAFILNEIEDNQVFQSLHPHAIPASTQLAIALHRFGNETKSFTDMAASFAVGDGSTITRCTDRVIEAVRFQRNKFLYMPDAAERVHLLEQSRQPGELDGATMFIDGTPMTLADRPVHDTDSYYSKAQKHSIQAQLICDSSKTIRSVHVGFPGSAHDARVFRKTDIYLNIDRYVGPEEFIAADKGYPLLKKVITPFKRNSTDGERFGFTEAQMRQFNTFFASKRACIEDVNGILKERFCSLKKLNVPIRNEQSHVKACHWFECCCILHNMIKAASNNGPTELEQEWEENVRANRQPEVEVESDGEEPNAAEDAGKIRRAEIVRRYFRNR